MKRILLLFFAVFIVAVAPSCSRKSGCPADSAQTKVDKRGQYKSGNAKSGLLPPKVYKKKAKGGK